MEEPNTRFGEFRTFISKQFELGNITELNGCKYCNSTGLKGGYHTQGDLCEACKGTGISTLKLLHNSGLFLCNSCNGYGFINGNRCKNCNGVGFVDWLDNIFDGIGATKW